MALLLFCWGAITIGSSGVTKFTSLAITRFLLGIFEAGKIPNKCLKAMLLFISDTNRAATRYVPRAGLLSHVLVQT